MFLGVATGKWVAITIVAILTIFAEIVIVFIILPWLEYRLGDRKAPPSYFNIWRFLKRRKKVRINNPVGDRSFTYHDLVRGSNPGVKAPHGGE